MTDEDDRPNPDVLLAALASEQSARGRLKIFLGAAPGVGKTFEMLAQARRRREAGEDVLAGVIETHGRAETEAQIGDLPLLPRKTIAYRGQVLEEFDLDTALATKPGLLLVDELAHTNAPGSRHAKRWEDVAELLDTGINVWATLNVQHLESLNDDIARITGIRPSETLPDRVLEMADEIEMVDTPPGELRARLQEGKIYRGDTARRALNGFFREGNLAALREIALRRAAARVDTDVRDWMRRSGISGPWPVAERVLALVGADDSADAVVRAAKRLSEALHAPWVAWHGEQTGASAEAQSLVRAAMSLAAQLGAEIDMALPRGEDLPERVLAAAALHNATHLVIGRAPAPLWRRALGRTLGAALLRQAPEFTILAVPVPGQQPRPRVVLAVQAARARWLPWAASPALIAALTAIGVWGRDRLPVEAADMVYLGASVMIAAIWGTGPGIFAALFSVLLWDYFFIPPIYTVTINSPRDLITALVFTAVALVTGSLAGRVRAEAETAAARVDGLRRIGAFSRKLGEPATEPELLLEIAHQAAELAGDAVVLSPFEAEAEGDLLLRAAFPGDAELDEGAMAAARWAWERGEPAGRGTSTLPSVPWHFLPMGTIRARLGVIGVRAETLLDAPRVQALETLVDQSAVALERVRLAASAARATAMEETQGLRSALLASLGHDLRTPLAGIEGAASTLRTAWGKLSDESRADLLASIEQDVGRMARFLAKITDLTRLEGGQIKPQNEMVKLADVVGAALQRLPELWHVAVRVPDDLLVQADPDLLEQAIFNVLENAVKYSSAGSLVRVQAEADRGEAILAITDEGVGIPAEDLPHVFDSFFRVSRGDRTVPGTGLGLAIARGLIEAMGGRIAAQSPSPLSAVAGPPGTVMTLYMPLSLGKKP
jgi:two-component system sensor histidine kinase KdpD